MGADYATVQCVVHEYHLFCRLSRIFCLMAAHGWHCVCLIMRQAPWGSRVLNDLALCQQLACMIEQLHKLSFKNDMHTHSQETRTEENRASHLETPAPVHQRHEGVCQFLDVCVCEVGNFFRKEVTCGIGNCPETDHQYTACHKWYASLGDSIRGVNRFRAAYQFLCAGYPQ